MVARSPQIGSGACVCADICQAFDAAATQAGRADVKLAHAITLVGTATGAGVRLRQ